MAQMFSTYTKSSQNWKRFVVSNFLYSSLNWNHKESAHSFSYRRNCGSFLIETTTYSMQMRMLQIICKYLRRDDDGVSMISAHKFIATFGKVKFTKDVRTAITEIFNKTSALKLGEKHQLLDHINSCLEKRSIHSFPIKSLNSMTVSAAYTGEVCRRLAFLEICFFRLFFLFEFTCIFKWIRKIMEILIDATNS